jgi:TPR repeat protein
MFRNWLDIFFALRALGRLRPKPHAARRALRGDTQFLKCVGYKNDHSSLRGGEADAAIQFPLIITIAGLLCCARKDVSMVIIFVVLFLSVIPMTAQAQPMPAMQTSEALLSQAKSGDAGAAYRLGKKLTQGIADKSPDYPQAIYWLQRAAQQSHSDAALLLALLYRKQPELAPKPTSAKEMFTFAFTLLNEAAEKGDEAAMARLGQIYAKGVFIPKDTKKAMAWLERAVKGGSPKAKSVLGRYAIWGTMPGYTEADALRLLQEAAEGGVISAWVQLGLAYTGAYNGTVNLPRAFDCFSKAASLGNNEGQRQMGLAYLSGFGVEKDIAKGRQLIQEAALGGNTEAMYNQAMMYRLGVGVAASDAEYINWLKKAAEEEHADAAYLLGDAFRYGKAIGQNREQALRYFRIARNKAHVMAIQALEEMAAESAE